MQHQDIRYIPNPFQRVFNIILPDKKKLYSLLMRLLQQFFRNVKLPTLNNYASDPKQSQNDITAYQGANGYLYMLIRLARYFKKEKKGNNQKMQEQFYQNKGQNQNYYKSFVQFANSKIIKSDMQLNKLMDYEFYLHLAQQEYNLISQAVLKSKPSKHLSFYMSQVCTWLCGMHLGYETNKLELFRENQNRLIKCYQTILQKGRDMIWQILYGVAGFLYAILQVQYYYDHCKGEDEKFKTNFGIISKQLTSLLIDRGIFEYQQTTGNKVNISKNLPEDFRLVYRFHKKQYLGGAHGLGGNLNIILMAIKMNQHKLHQDQMNKYLKLIHPSIIFLLKHFINGNFTSSKGSQNVKLVHFCHGAPGIINCLTRFMQMFPQWGIQMGIAAVIERALDHIWKYGVLKKGFGLCHGISGNAYVFLSKNLYNILPDRAQEYRKKALLFALLREQAGVMKEISTYHFQDRYVVGKSDNPFSLMLGIAGDICFVIDAFDGVNRFPGFNLEI